MANENDTRLSPVTMPSDGTLVVPEGRVVSESFRVGDVITLAAPRASYVVFDWPTHVEWLGETRVLTPEEEAQQVEWRHRAEAYRARIRETQVKALGFLKTLLTQVQRDQLQQHHWFEVVGSQSHQTYRIHLGTQGNVRLMKGQQEIVSYCAAPDRLAPADAMLAQKLQIECDEPAFLAVANATCMRTGMPIPRRADVLRDFREWWNER